MQKIFQFLLAICFVAFLFLSIVFVLHPANRFLFALWLVLVAFFVLSGIVLLIGAFIQSSRSSKRVVFLWVGIIIFVFFGIYPPWIYSLETLQANLEIDAGYAYITKSPQREWKGKNIKYKAKLNITRLCVQWVIVAVITSGLIYTFKEENDEKTKYEKGKTE